MEYGFGTRGASEILKTKGQAHTDLKGFQTVSREYPDQTVTDSFRVLRKLKSDEDSEGNCYDFYEIDRHNRIIDKTPAVKAELLETQIAVAELAETILGGA